MRKIIFYLLAVMFITACECPFETEICSNCRRPLSECRCYPSSYGNSDYFSAATLVGEWQMVGYNDDAYMDGCGLIPKDIVFASQPVGEFGRCTMTYAIGRDPQWYQVDLYYNFVRRELTFYYVDEYGEMRKLFAFTYTNFLFPTLTMKDSFGTYDWNKVRVTTPN